MLEVKTKDSAHLEDNNVIINDNMDDDIDNENKNDISKN